MRVEELFALPELPVPCFVVGGWVRDRLLGRKSLRPDVDLVLPRGAVKVASIIAQKLGAGFVVMDAERQIARVVLPHLTIDFAQEMGNSLMDDLSRRDFTINAIAIEIHHPEAYIDPHGGRSDLDRKMIRAIAHQNLAADPLRVLRAYRLAAQLNFQIEANTHDSLRKCSAGLGTIASERVQMELCHLLLGGELGTTWLINALHDRILRAWLTEAVLEIPRFRVIDQVIAQLLSAYPQLHGFFQQNITRERSVMVAIKLAALVNTAHAIAPLGFSRSEQKWILGILRHLPQLGEIVTTTPEPIITYQFCQRVKEFFPALVAIALADGMPLADLQPLLERWLDPCDPIFYPRQLLTGAEIRDQFHLKPSPKIGELLEAVRFAQIRGQIHDRGGALNLVAKLLASTTP